MLSKLKLLIILISTLFISAPGAVFAEEPTISLKPLPKVCYELGSSVLLEGDYPPGVFSDFAIFYSSDPAANTPTLAGLLAHPVLRLPFEYVLPLDFPKSDSIRFWVAGHDENHKRTTIVHTRFLSTSDRCLRPFQVLDIQPERVNQREVNVAWSTNYPATAYVEYGTTDKFGTSTAEISGSTDEQKTTLKGLGPETLYYFRIVARDQNGTLAYSRLNTFTTLPLSAKAVTETDTIAVTISDIYVNHLSVTKKDVTWQTDFPADSEVEYGLTPQFGFTATDETATTSHSVILDNLLPQRIYYYLVKSKRGVEKSVSERLRFAAVESPFSSVTAETLAKTQPPVFKIVLRKEQENEDVRQLQIKLQELGYFPARIKPTGYFGPVTESSLKLFQKARGLALSGELDRQTFKALYFQQTGAIISAFEYGTRSEGVRKAQALLSGLTFFPRDALPTGYFGPLTQEALKAFQSFYGMNPTGEFNAETVSRLNNLLLISPEL